MYHNGRRFKYPDVIPHQQTNNFVVNDNESNNRVEEEKKEKSFGHSDLELGDTQANMINGQMRFSLSNDDVILDQEEGDVNI